MATFPDGVIFRERDGLALSLGVRDIFEKLRVLDSKPLSTGLDELQEGSQGDIMVMKPENRFLRLDKRVIDHKDYIYVINSTPERKQDVLVSVFMRIVFDKLKTSFDSLIGTELTGLDQATAEKLCYELAMAENLTDQLFYFSSVATGPLRLVTDRVSPEKLVEWAVERASEIGVSKNRTVVVECDDDLPQIRIDRKKIGDCLLTLLCNSLSYSPASEAVTISAGVSRVGTSESLYMRVSDRGRGMPPETIAKIFDKHYHVERMINSGDKASRVSIGLPYLKYIVESHGGSVGVSSVPGEGTTFEMSFPLSLMGVARKNPVGDPADLNIKIEPWGIDAEFPAREGFVGQVVDLVERTMASREVPEDEMTSMSLVISESLANSIMHGPKGEGMSIRMVMEFRDDGVVFGVRDLGGKFFYPSFFEQLARDRGMKAGGRGILFIKHFMDEIIYLINRDISTWLILFKAL